MGPRDAPPDQAQTARRRERLAREVGVVLAVKLAALALLWFAFFRAPPPADPQRLFAPAQTTTQESER
ncbi:MAG: cytochrome oxidase putative small subunit CydP [Sphingomonadaceae bacterium]|jgi:hypothetical protein